MKHIPLYCLVCFSVFNYVKSFDRKWLRGFCSLISCRIGRRAKLSLEVMAMYTSTHTHTDTHIAQNLIINCALLVCIEIEKDKQWLEHLAFSNELFGFSISKMKRETLKRTPTPRWIWRDGESLALSSNICTTRNRGNYTNGGTPILVLEMSFLFHVVIGDTEVKWPILTCLFVRNRFSFLFFSFSTNCNNFSPDAEFNLLVGKALRCGPVGYPHGA